MVYKLVFSSGEYYLKGFSNPTCGTTATVHIGAGGPGGGDHGAGMMIIVVL